MSYTLYTTVYISAVVVVLDLLYTTYSLLVACMRDAVLHLVHGKGHELVQQLLHSNNTCRVACCSLYSYKTMVTILTFLVLTCQF